LWEGEAGEAGAVFFSRLMDEALPRLEIRAGDYPDLYRSLLVGQNVRPRVPVHPRLHIWGPFEARLQQPDIVVLGSLNEGTWPEATDPGPWLNRPMRQALGLPSPEEKIGHGAHDFSSLLGAERAILTRAAKIDGVPTVPSRWLMRLQAVLGGIGLADRLQPDQPWLSWARARDSHGPPRRAKAPEPRPPVALRPRRLSVTGVETWIANPYGIFARHVLGLDPLDPLDKEPDAALKGGIIHNALGRFASLYSDALPRDGAAELVRLAREALGPHVGHPRVAAFWLPRFERFAEWFAETEPRRRSGIARVLAELSGALVLDAPAGPFTLTARADRIDVRDGANITIVDYKTGATPTPSRVLGGEAPQLPLEAAIAAQGGFDRLDAAHVAALSYIRVTGAEPPGEERPIACDDPMSIAREALAGLMRLITTFDSQDTPYKAIRRHTFRDIYRFDSYAHLARAAEWAGAAIEET
jgi:ATP-dependent helicase/nuclease subunit B